MTTNSSIMMMKIIVGIIILSKCPSIGAVVKLVDSFVLGDSVAGSVSVVPLFMTTRSSDDVTSAKDKSTKFSESRR